MRIAVESVLSRIWIALLWRIHRLFGNHIRHRLRMQLARHWRPMLRKPVFICITGSAGKTTTKELMFGMLSHRRCGTASRDSLNGIGEVPKTILRARPQYDFCVSELGAPEPSSMDEPLFLLKPTIGIVTVIANDHWGAYKSLEAIALEKGKLVASLPATGTAVLNADDELVMGMATRCPAKIITYGVSDKAEIRAEDVSAVWPERLSFTLIRGNERIRIKTRLCGSHWLPSVLGAIAGANAMGLSLEECAEGIATVEPFPGRMQPLEIAKDLVVIRDDYKAPLWTVEGSLDFMKTAQAKRKVIVIGTLSDRGAGAGWKVKYARVARHAQEIADLTVFIGQHSSDVLGARRPGAEDALRTFGSVQEASAFINANLRDGDLILLKGTNRQDHLCRILMARSEDIACWRDDCMLDLFCDECRERKRPSGLSLLQEGGAEGSIATMSVPQAGRSAIKVDEQVIVGLGNPGGKYSGTPHNVGYEVVDRIAVSLGLTWEEWSDSSIARGVAGNQEVCLVKMGASMNLIGPNIKVLSKHMSFVPEQCILVLDDLDLQMGTVRTSMKGGAGGHRGVASILEAFQTDQFRRVKVGVGKKNVFIDRAAYVLAPISVEDRPAIDAAIVLAEKAVLELVTSASKEQCMECEKSTLRKQ